MLKDTSFHSPIWMGFDDLKHIFSLPLYNVEKEVQHCRALVVSALTVLVGQPEGHPACKKLSGGVLTGARCRLAYGPADATASHCLLLQ